MKKIYNKIGFIVMTLVLTLGMSVSVFADNPNPSTGSTITFDKVLKVTNPTLTSVDGPGLSYSYTIAPETPSATNGGTSITSGNNTGTVYVGPADGLTLNSPATVSWPKGTAVNASATGVDNVKSVTATADPTKFTRPGIYRYKVTESADPADPSTLGVTDTDTAEVRYFDVYVENDTTGYKIVGIVMHDGSTANGAPSQKKTFDPSQFDTQNLKVNKVVMGNMADKNHEFKFVATVSDNGRYYFDGEGADASAATNQNSTGNSEAYLKDGENLWVCGVSSVAKVNVTETNDTTDTYTTSVSGLKTVAGSEVAPNGTASSGEVTMSQSGDLVFTNALDSVSPTGVLLRFGPFVLLALLAGVLIMFNRRVKVEK